MVREAGADHIRRADPTSRSERAAHYRDYANQMRDLAEGEPNRKLRQRLTELARQYDALAEELDPKRD